MAHIVVCLYCKEKFDTELEPFIKPNRTRYAHKRCADKKDGVTNKFTFWCHSELVSESIALNVV